MKVWAYLRTSRTAQCEENQRVGVDELAKKLDLKIDKYFIDKCSGTIDPNERNLGKILRRADDSTILICSELSRISRSAMTLIECMSIFLKKGVKVYTVKESYKLSSELNSLMMLFVYALSYQVELEMIHARTKENKRRYKMRLESGDPTLKPLGRPLGSITKNHKLDPHKTRLLNDYDKGISISRLARRYNCSTKTIKRYIIKNRPFND
jgi:DNA invertase Pin-like site-specific DNA recombinase